MPGMADANRLTLTRHATRHEWAQGVHPFFQHLGPEGWLREKQTRFGHIFQDDDFGLLLRYGADCIGAVGVRPSWERTPNDAAGTEITASPRAGPFPVFKESFSS